MSAERSLREERRKPGGASASLGLGLGGCRQFVAERLSCVSVMAQQLRYGPGAARGRSRECENSYPLHLCTVLVRVLT